MNMAGAVCIAPVLGVWLRPVLAPVFQVFGANPAMFATSILACDMGGFPLAHSLAGGDVNAGNFAGMILGSMMGPTIVFSIPVGLGIIRMEDRPFLGKGILIGLCTIPLGCLAGGAVAGYNFLWMFRNLIPVIIFAAIIAAGLIFFQKTMITIFLWFGRFIVAFLTLSLVIAGIEYFGDVTIIKAMDNGAIVRMDNIESAFIVVGQIAVVLAGAYVLVSLLIKFFGKPLEKVGGLMGVNKDAAAGLVATLANNIAMFQIMKDMDDRGKVINVAFAVSAAFVFGDHLGFCGGNAPDMISAMVVGKLVGGITAVMLALLFVPKKKAA
jgi:ethanolamine transporter